MNKYIALMILIFAPLWFSSAHANSHGYRDYQLCRSPGFMCVKNRYGELVLIRKNTKQDYQTQHRKVSQHRREPAKPRVQPPEKISSGNIVNVDLGNLTWGAYDHDGNLVRSGHVSGGKSYCPDIGRKCRTVTGTFTIYSKKGAGCKSTKFPVGKGGAPMPYCMFFKGGYALHGSNAVPNYNASHGCVRMHPSDAQWLNQEFVQVGRTRVNIRY